MNYWNNPIKTSIWPTDAWPSTNDVIVKSLHYGSHCLYHDPEFDHKKIVYKQKLRDLCDWINQSVDDVGVDSFLSDIQNHYDIANIVKLNMWIADIQNQGIVKPMLVTYDGNTYSAANGESRLRCLEILPNITSVTAIITTSAIFKEQFAHLERVNTFDHFAKICHAVNGQEFLFRLTDYSAIHGLDWYEYNSQKTTNVTPGQDYCVAAVTAYLQKHPDTQFTPEWFANPVDWNQYKNF